MENKILLLRGVIMAHQLQENDFMFSANGIRPWHGLGVVVEEAPTQKDAIKLAKLDWKVEKLPVFANVNGKTVEIQDRYALMRMDTKFCTGMAMNRYNIVQNSEAFSFVDDIIKNEKGAVRYETAGSLYNGKKIFLLVKMPETKVLGDNVENYLFFTNSHDGLNAVKAGISNVRVVCDNTLQMAMRGATRTWSAHHTKSVKSKQEEAIRTLQLASTYIKEMPKMAELMAAKKVSVDKIVPLFFTKAELETESAQTAVMKIVTIAKQKDDLQNFKNTAWGVYNALADFISHPTGKSQFRSQDRKMDAFLKGHTILGKAQKILLSA